MATPNLHLLSFFFFFSTLLGLFHSTLSLINPEDVPSWLAFEETEDVNMVQTSRDSWKKCDFSVGKWVFDQSYPLYDSNCPYLATAVTCQKNGRPDSDYEKWKWKPLGCSIPRWDYYMQGNSIITNMNQMVAYEKGLSTWAKWVDLNLDPRKTRVVFRSMSPRHNRQNGWKCYNQRQPVKYFSHLHVPGPLVVLKGVLKRMRFPVYLQDITTMTAFRRDGHPSVYSKALSQEERQKQGSDCSHWCLPGVPDIWNEMLSAWL
ncbi:hypothetical protein TSUD_51180 [Trifolium subterraneum]|uniref:Trichome birefringence-like C-terminal domain-containing protein n=1 Tax=Trifolium subterraneum TaxID=3900 RepID=A0A2Z6M722_TRISU|nr:hypothetical protein TSUD_51180 [Trifolium subterraneum]